MNFLKRLLTIGFLLIVCTVLGTLGMFALDFLGVGMHLGSRAMWTHGGIVAVGNGYSVQLLTHNSSPIGMAEYDQRLEIFGGTERDGKRLGTIDLFPNTGGRTCSLIYTYITKSGQRRVQIQDRFGIDDVDLATLKKTNPGDTGEGGSSRSNVDPVPTRQFVGTYSEEAYPLKFVPPSILPEEKALAKVK